LWLLTADDRTGADRGLQQLPGPRQVAGLEGSCGAVHDIEVDALRLRRLQRVRDSLIDSVRDTMTDIWLGSFARGVHYWAAQAMYVLVVLHLLRVIFHGSYKRPREGNYLVGVTMFALVIAALFTGTVLKWDQEGFEALGHNIEIGELLGGLGYWFTPDVADSLPILVRLYAAHVMMIPGLIVVLFTLHALLVKRHGISPHPAIPDQVPEVSEPFTHHLRRVGAFGLLLVGVLGVLAVLWPPMIGPLPGASGHRGLPRAVLQPAAGGGQPDCRVRLCACDVGPGGRRRTR
jgi:cytochrome b561